MRIIAWILLGALIGAFAGTSAFKALRTHTDLQRGVMQVTGYHLGALREAIGGSDCFEKAKPHLNALAMLATDIGPAFGEFAMQDEIFVGYAGKLIAATSAARDHTAEDCKALGEAIAPIRDACQACHRDYK